MKFFHTALSVKNLEESEKFYETLLGFKRTTYGERPEIGIKFIMMKDENGMGLELFEHTTPQHLTDDLMDFSQNGLKHIAFEVENVDELVEKAVTLGATIKWPPQKGVTVARLAFILDPNNIPIELAQR